MKSLLLLKEEMARPGKPGQGGLWEYYMFRGFSEAYDEPVSVARGIAAASLFTRHTKHVYKNDRIAGSLRGMSYSSEEIDEGLKKHAAWVVCNYGGYSYHTNIDHACCDFAGFLKEGIPGVLGRIDAALLAHRDDEKKAAFVRAAGIAMEGFAAMARGYGDAAEERAALPDVTENQRAELLTVAETCRFVAENRPETFRQALQLVFLAHTAFVIEKRNAMALGRMDQYLRPFYEADLSAGRITREEALSLLACTLYKIGERNDTINIAVGGVKRDGTGGVNELSYLMVEAVKACGIPGPNLSARLYTGVPDEFIDACLQSIGTGLGYPALMNDDINIPALHRHGYELEDCRDYCMVGCIENFLPGLQPPWSDGRYNSPKYLEYALNNGKCLQSGVQRGLKTGEPEELADMDALLAAVERQMAFGASEYSRFFKNEFSERYNKSQFAQPFMSCFYRDCIGRGLDINDGGTLYPSVHGACCMGIATVADSLAAIEQLVFKEKRLTLAELRDVLAADFEGHDDIQNELLKAPKYGNNDDRADRFAVWFVEAHDRAFSPHRTWDGGPIYILIASNVQNIDYGRDLAATADGRKNKAPLSDAASPMRGCDKKGPTAVALSTAKPDYRLVSGGTVLNQKLGPEMFEDPEKRERLLSLVKVYFAKGGQELQINAVSRKVLQDAMENPGEHEGLVVRVSGFSAYFTQLDRRVQEDILQRTEHGV